MNAWFKYHHDTPYDPKWDRVAHRAGCTYRDVLAVWNVILTEASKSEDRGSVTWFNAEDVANALRWDEQSVSAVFEAMRGVVHDGLRLKSWERRQKKDDTAPARQKRKREIDRSEYLAKCASAHDSLRHGTQRDSEISRHESRVDERREETHTTGAHGNLREPSLADVDTVIKVVLDAAGALLASPNLATEEIGVILGLMGPGLGPPCDLRADIEPAIRRARTRKPPGSVTTLRYFIDPARENRDARIAGAPAIESRGDSHGPASTGGRTAHAGGNRSGGSFISVIARRRGLSAG